MITPVRTLQSKEINQLGDSFGDNFYCFWTSSKRSVFLDIHLMRNVFKAQFLLKLFIKLKLESYTCLTQKCLIWQHCKASCYK